MIGKRLQIQYVLILLMLLGLGFRLFQIQILDGQTYSQMAQRQHIKKFKSETIRGEILDRNGLILATSIKCQSIYAHPRQMNASKGQVALLGKTLNIQPKLIKNKISSKGNFVWIERKVHPLTAGKISKQKIKGLGMVTEQKRYYPNGTLASHLLGSVGVDNYGLSGLEQTLDSTLKGEFLILTRLRDGKGRNMLPGIDSAEKKPLKNSITLSIDRTLQYYAEKELKAGVEENQAKSGMIIIQNPKTGEILAMASYPNFDPNLLSQGKMPKDFKRQWLQNPAISQTFEPGSTFKIVTIAAALEEKEVTPKTIIDCENGKWKVANKTITDHEPEGRLPVSQVLERSSNIGTGKIGQKLGKERLYHYIRAFGFGTRTGLPIPGETNGILRDPKDWSKLSLPTISFGQEIGVTAMQLIGSFTVIANGGLLMEPQIIRTVKHPSTQKTISDFKPRIVRRSISAPTARQMRKMMVGVVEKGTGLRAKVAGYTVGGKTGTAQKFNPEAKRYSSEKYVASFGGFIPAEDPALVCLVILDEPKRTYWASETAAPIFSRVMSRAVSVLDILPSKAALLAGGVKSSQEVRLLASRAVK